MSVATLVRPETEEAISEQIPEGLVSLAYSVDWSAREWLVVGSDMVTLMSSEYAYAKARTLALLLDYEHRRVVAGGRSGRRKKEPMDVEAMVESWTEVLVALATAHDHETRSRADHQTDDLLRPLLNAPIGQLRQFSAGLAKRLRDDPRVPFMIWSGFHKVIEPLVRISPEGEVIELREQLANEVAELVEKDLDRAQLVKAIAGALQWRNPKALTAIKSGLEAGEKPKIRGRESCLFLEVGDQLVVL